jgi:hypothetical protein
VRDDRAVAGGRRVHPARGAASARARLGVGELAELVLTHHDRRLRNPGEADWVVHAGGVAIIYDWPDGNDSTTALVISVWRE